MNDKKKIADLERRLVLIEDDAKMLARHLELIQAPAIEDSNGFNYHNYLGNILECVDLKSDEHTQYVMWNEDSPNKELTLPDADSLNKTAVTMNSNYAQTVDNIIDKLKEIGVDGETMQFIVGCVGLEEQLHRQFIVSTFPTTDTTDLVAEKQMLDEEDLIRDGKLRAKIPPFEQRKTRREIDAYLRKLREGEEKKEYNLEFHLKATAKKVWDDIYNNDHLWANDFESYYTGKN